MRCLLFLSATFPIITAASEARKAAALAELQGRWVSVVSDFDGRQGDLRPDLDFVIEGNRWAVMGKGRERNSGTIELDPTKSPAHMDLTFKAGHRSPGIYRLDGDTLTFCHASANCPRPVRLESLPGRREYFIIYRRIGR